MKAEFSPSLQKEIIKLQKKNKKLVNKIEKQIYLFEQNPIHPSLRNHKLSGNLNDMWSISITMGIRMLYQLQKDGSAYFTDMGTHDEVYEK
jgi:addiction module RelE/StbE family toxin